MKRLLALLALVAAPAALAVDVEGYIYTPDGTPVASATVVAAGQSVTTDAEGHFTVNAPADSLVSLDVRAEHLPSVKVLALAGDPPLTITLAPSPNEGMMMTTATAMPAARGGGVPASAGARDRTISGAVRIGKRTLANAPVLIQAMSEVFIPPTTVTTDAKGRYRVSVPSGRYYVSIGEGVAPRLRPAGDRMMDADGGTNAMVDLTSDREAVRDLELVAAPLITGRLVDADDKPAGRADVLIVMAGRSPLEFFHQPIVRTLPNGRFAIPAPFFPPNERVEIVATPPRHSPTRSKAFLLSEAKETTITLPKFETVTVRVADREGKPLPDSVVAYALTDETATFGGDASIMLMPHLARRRFRTEDGAVTLQLTAGEYVFAASAPRYQPKTETRTITKPVAFDLVLELGHAIRGRVHRGERPVSGAQVTIRGGQVMRGERSATTDEKGLFVFESLPRGTYVIGIFKSEELIDKMLTTDAPSEVDVDLPPLGTLQGRVVDAATRAPIAAFLYTLEPLQADEPGMRGRHMQRGSSGSDGTFSVSVPIGGYRLTAGSGGYLPSEPVEVRVTEDGAPPIEIALGRGATISGRVIDEDGKPLLEANVMIMNDVGEISRSARSATRVSPAAATTGEDGAFSISGVATGPAQLVARRSGYAMERRPIDVDGDLQFDIVLPRGLSITGVVTLNGKPVSGASVDAMTPAVNADHQSTMTDEQGRFTIAGLVPGRYTLNANRDEHHAQLENVDATQRREVVIELEGKGRGVIFGTVSGVPRSGGKITRGSVFAQSPQVGAEATIDDAGNYRIENAPAGTVEIVAHVETLQGSRSTMRKRVELAPGQSLRVDLDLTPGITVTGRVTHGASRPVARAQVVFHSDESGMVSAMTREDGSYEAGLPGPGRYQIYANAEELMSRNYQTVREIRGSETFDIQLTESVIEGVVLDAATSQPLPDALVTLVPRQSVQQQMTSGETMTDANGRFSITTAASGPHLLIAAAPGHAQRTQEVSLGGTAPQRMQLELAGAVELRVRIVDAKTRTPLEAHLVLADEKGTYLPVRSTRSADGAEFLFSLAPGRYRVKALTMGYAEKTVDVTAPGTITIPLD